MKFVPTPVTIPEMCRIFMPANHFCVREKQTDSNVYYR